ncbi:probable splicing factor 3A subunit 1 [Arabidopsis lyrata subsp. lyrata]|uniref:probable splicing factor 3A subunit 1 n=1 Tax=Arabidopsis lyrata subsp. lyrata TaxID=81972 RepID=UPI000A29A877|nr:probable splicing factor 3A subunit 1 [Arabidopsis lyrata subsp. lyrata]|eukprot:XP_020872663.1 probable splicing factor 3A subunit 1 [Arabidopsis lyrata subsp. lyrata]
MSENNDDTYQGHDLKTIIERTAEFIAKNGAEYEKEFLESHPKLTFFVSSDPNHAFYQDKLIEYRNASHDHNATDDDSDDNVESSKIIPPPPGGVTNRIQGTALYVAKKGFKAGKMLMQSEANNPKYNFMRRSDPYHAFYKQKLAEYRSQVDDDSTNSDDITDEEVVAAARLSVAQAEYIFLPNRLLICLPHGMRIEEFNTMKLTAQFVAWYGGAFWLCLKNRKILPKFEFLEQSAKWYSCFSKFVLEFSKVLMPPADVKQELINSADYVTTIVDAFLQRLQWSALQHQLWTLRNQIQRDKSCKSQPLFQKTLAQNPGSSTIKVSVPNAGGGGKVIEIIVQSLSENVASLKEKIAEEIQVPANTHKLSGKAGVLDDDNKSLAHYNVGVGDTLTLSL